MVVVGRVLDHKIKDHVSGRMSAECVSALCVELQVFTIQIEWWGDPAMRINFTGTNKKAPWRNFRGTA